MTALGPVAALVLTLLAPVPASATACPLDGLGTGEQPWEVATAADLALVGQGDCGLDGVYRQTADITLTEDWTQIGTSSNQFAGTYDGGGFTISGMDSTSGGMFSYLHSDGTIRRVRLIEVDVVGNGVTTGGLVDSNYGTVEDSSISGEVTRNASNARVGGLVGYNQKGAVIRRSSSSAAVTGGQEVGGLVGQNAGLIEYSFATGPVTSTGSRGAGGLSGDSLTGTIRDSFARGSVTGAGDVDAGGLLGVAFLVPVVERSFSTGAVTSDRGRAGGLLGAVSGNAPVLRDLYWDKNSSGQERSRINFSQVSDVGAKTTDQMQDIATFANWTIEATCEVGGFDPDNNKVWGICPTINDGYPFLRWITVTAASSGSSSTTTAAPSTPVRIGEVLPSLPAGDATWNRADGTLRPLTATASAERTITYRDDSTTTSLGITGAAGTSTATGVVAEVDGELVCEICAELAAGSVIEVWMFSEPRLVAAHRVEDLPCQRFVVPLGAPLDGGGSIPAGAHTLQLAIPTAAGMEAVDVGITVGGPVPTTVPAGEGPAPTPWPFALTFAAVLALGLAVTARRAVTGPS